ncbi:hypothetical protein SLE2022_334600 [Rubroshorea leprosula]
MIRLHPSPSSVPPAAHLNSVCNSDVNSSLPSVPLLNNVSTLTKTHKQPLLAAKFCSCGRRHFIESAAATVLPILCPSAAFSLDSNNYQDMLKRIRPPRPDWYEELYASVLNSCTKSYEAEVAVYKSQLFANLRGKAKKVLEIGIGTGPNLEYYTGDTDVQIFGVDPNKKMEKYARAAAVAAGLPVENFKFVHAVAEAVPLSDCSVDAVVGTLVLCSVKDVEMALKEVKRVLKPGGLFLFVEHVAAKDRTIHKFLQSILDPLQQTLADGCHLTRETGKDISAAGFSNVELSMAFLSNASLLNPHIYGVARK